MKTTTDESFLFQKKFVMWERYKCLELKKEICNHNKFEILSEQLGNGELSADSIVEKFFNTTNSIAKDLSITSSTEIRKAMFRISYKIYCFQKRKLTRKVNAENIVRQTSRANASE